jgi:hypothetical protein
MHKPLYRGGAVVGGARAVVVCSAKRICAHAALFAGRCGWGCRMNVVDAALSCDSNGIK